MEELIRKIIEVDKEARQKTEESKQQLARSKTAIEQRKKELEAQYNESVNEIIELTTQDEEEKVALLKQQLEKQFGRESKALEENFHQHKNEWVEEIVKRTLA